MKKNNFPFISLLIFFVLFFSLSGCLSLQINNNTFNKKQIEPNSKIFCESIKIISSFSEDTEYLQEILMQKILFQLEKQEKIELVLKKEDSNYIILPQLIIKKYPENFLDYFYYGFSFLIIDTSNFDQIANFLYEYSGNLSIFNNKLIDKFIIFFINDLLKVIKKK